MVDKARFGERRVCFACGCKFYDMHRSPPTCPRCGTDVSTPPAPEVEEIELEPDLEDDIPEDLDSEEILEPEEDIIDEDSEE